MTEVVQTGESSALVHDALCELVNIGSGNAVTTLSRMLDNVRINLSVPHLIESAELGELPGAEAQGVLVDLGITGVVGGSFLASFEQGSALSLSGALLGRQSDQIGVMEESAIVEAVNIISSSFLGALSSLLKGVLIPSPPRATYGRLIDLLTEQVERSSGVLMVTSRFEANDCSFSGNIIILADDQAAEEMARAVGVPV